MGVKDLRDWFEEAHKGRRVLSLLFRADVRANRTGHRLFLQRKQDQSVWDGFSLKWYRNVPRQGYTGRDLKQPGLATVAAVGRSDRNFGSKGCPSKVAHQGHS